MWLLMTDSLGNTTTSSSTRRGENGSLSAHAYRAVGDMIKDRRLKGGEVIVEQRLADELGISRTPLREALQRLEGEGLVVKTANRSFVVRHVELKEYLHSLKVREVLEAEAASLAAGHVDPDALAAIRAESLAVERTEPYDTHAHWAADDLVHNLFIDACGNAVMADILRHLRATTRLFEIARLADRLGPDSREHMAILDALQAGDAKASRRAVAAHIRSLFRFAVETIR
jgi:DNA-binding GntR family transcriptional regulator